jgi:hypothetical protein
MRWLSPPLLAAALALLAAAPPAAADEVRFPLSVGYDLLGTALRAHLNAPAAGGLELWRSRDGCGSFVLRDARLAAEGGRVKIVGPAAGEAGLSLFGWCWATMSWTGHAEISARPEIGADWQLRLHDFDVQLEDARPRRGVAPRLAPVVAEWAEAGLARFTFDLGPPVRELSALLAAFSRTGEVTPLKLALETVRPVGLEVAPDVVRVLVALDVPPATGPTRLPEPALTAAERQRWEARLDHWDGFLSFVVRDLAGDNPDPAARDDLLNLLLETRREVVGILERGPDPGTDTVRRIFLSKWERLRAIVKRTPVPPSDDVASLFHYVVFLAAGDALAAIDAVAPAAGLDFSADGLRRLARTLEPGFPGDPLEQSDAADPRLQEIFRFRDPDAPPRGPRARPPSRIWEWLTPRPAHAHPQDEWGELNARLDRWVPSRRELETYRETMDRLLSMAAERTLDPDRLDERFDDLFEHLVKATAWQESCWRQFVREGGAVTYIKSSTADVGLMQINVRVWRGFFDTTKLRWNTAYNAGAGAEILHQLLFRYGAREAHRGLENAARASYSAYQGGPSRYQRYRTAPPASRGAAIDRAFWEKYQAVAAGTAEDDVLCLRPRRTS